MQLPSTVIIGPYTYELTKDPATFNQISTDKTEFNWGWCQYGPQRIAINPSQAPTHERVSVLHELLHAIAYIADQRLDKEEELIRSMTAPLLDVLRRNPDLVQYLVEE